MSKISWDSKSCSRCGGGGQYSFNLTDGSRCYGCGGSGLALTKRGKAARDAYYKSLEKPLSKVKPGDQVYDYVGAGNKLRWQLVIDIRPEAGGLNEGALVMELKSCLVMGLRPDSVLKSVSNQGELDAKIAAAMAYQASLDGNGKPAKSAA